MKISTLFIAIISLLLLSTREAHAYIDPGSGSYLFQILTGLLLGGIFALKMFWMRIRTTAAKIFSRQNEGAVENNRANK